MDTHAESGLDLTFHALAHPVRRAILVRLVDRSATILEIAGQFDMSLNGVSKHVKVLEHAGLIQREIQGRTHHCSLDATRLREAGAWIDYYRPYWERRLNALGRFLATPHEEPHEEPSEEPSEGEFMEPEDRTDPHTLTISRVLRASRQAVFDAWTTVESVQQWMCPEAASIPLAELDVRVGGMFRVDMHVDGERVVHTGVYREVQPPEKLVFTWTSKYTRHHDTLVTVELHALGDQTELVLIQTLLPDEDATENHARGWTQIVEHLAAYLLTR